MEPYLLAVIGLMVLAYLRQDRRHDRECARLAKETSDTRTELQLAHIASREQTAKLVAEYREDIAKLCQRIQAPEAAVVEHQIDHGRQGEAILALSDEEAAEREDQMRAAVAAIEAEEAEMARFLNG